MLLKKKKIIVVLILPQLTCLWISGGRCKVPGTHQGLDSGLAPPGHRLWLKYRSYYLLLYRQRRWVKMVPRVTEWNSQQCSALPWSTASTWYSFCFLSLTSHRSDMAETGIGVPSLNQGPRTTLRDETTWPQPSAHRTKWAVHPHLSDPKPFILARQWILFIFPCKIPSNKGWFGSQSLWNLKACLKEAFGSGSQDLTPPEASVPPEGPRASSAVLGPALVSIPGVAVCLWLPVDHLTFERSHLWRQRDLLPFLCTWSSQVSAVSHSTCVKNKATENQDWSFLCAALKSSFSAGWGDSQSLGKLWPQFPFFVTANMPRQCDLIKGWTQIVAVQSLNHIRLFATPWTASRQASLSSTISRSLLKLTSIKSVISNHLILCCPLLLLPSIFPSIRVFSTLYIKGGQIKNTKSKPLPLPPPFFSLGKIIAMNS